MNKTLIILIGLKGSGKTYIGKLIEKELNIKFFQVEKVWINIKEERFSDRYINCGYSIIESEIDTLFKKTNKLVIESTAAHEECLNHFRRLKKKYSVILVRINTPLNLCLKRVKSRDKTDQVPISFSQINEINLNALSMDITADFIINNEKATDEEILNTISSIV